MDKEMKQQIVAIVKEYTEGNYHLEIKEHDLHIAADRIVKLFAIPDVVVRLFDPKENKPRPSENDPTFSEDVCIIDENNVQGVACYVYEDERWLFHTDTLVNYDEIGAETKWLWYYPIVSAKDVF